MAFQIDDPGEDELKRPRFSSQTLKAYFKPNYEFWAYVCSNAIGNCLVVLKMNHFISDPQVHLTPVIGLAP
jgi:hypothetical protein